MKYVQYGCGHDAPLDWENFDSSPTLLLEKFPVIGKYLKKNDVRFPANVRRGNIVTGLPIEPNSASAVYCSHTLEHLALDEFRVALQNSFVMLAENGVFRLVVPDLEYYINNYNRDDAANAAHIFLEDTMLGRHRRPHGLFDFLKNWIGGSSHYWMWDYKAMEMELTKVGFVKIRRAKFGDAADPKFNSVENENRWVNCLGIECTKSTQSNVS